MAEFYPDGESSHRSEKLDIKWSDSLIVQIGKNYCGKCRTTVKGAEECVTCPDPACGIKWGQVIYAETIVPFRHQYLAMISHTVLARKDTLPKSDFRSSYPEIGRRAVETIRLTSELL